MRLTEDPVVVTGNHRRPTFLLCIPTLGMTPIEFTIGMMRMQFPVNCQCQSFVAKGMEVGVARNYAVEQVLKMNPRPEYLCFIGDDMLPNSDSLLLLYDEMRSGKWDVLSGLYHTKARTEAVSVPVMWRVDKNGPMVAGVDYQVGETVEVHVTGMDFCLIKSDIFEKLGPAPWFKTSDHSDMINSDGSLNIFTEDSFFCKNVMEKGFKTGVVTKVRVGHIDAKTGEVY